MSEDAAVYDTSQQNTTRNNPMSTEQSLLELLQQRVALFAQSDRPAEIIDQHVEKMMQSVIEDLFRSYGDMGKAVRAAVSDAMPGDISEHFQLAKYNSIVTNALQKKWADSAIPNEMVKRASDSLDEVMSGLVMPETVSLKALIESFIELHADEAMQEGWGYPDVRISESESVSGCYNIYFSKEPKAEGGRHSRELSKYELDNNIGVFCRDNKNDNGDPIGKVYTGKIDGDVLHRKHSHSFSEHEKLIVSLYYGNAKLIVDCDEDDFYYPNDHE